MSDPTLYPWNVRIEPQGVAFIGPGFETRSEAQTIANSLEKTTEYDAEVFRQ